jgi:hypothetical protein
MRNSQVAAVHPPILVTAGAVSLADKTANIVSSASAIMRVETGHVAPWFCATMAAARMGISPPPIGAASWYKRCAPYGAYLSPKLLELVGRRFAAQTSCVSVGLRWSCRERGNAAPPGCALHRSHTVHISNAHVLMREYQFRLLDGATRITFSTWRAPDDKARNISKIRRISLVCRITVTTRGAQRRRTPIFVNR